MSNYVNSSLPGISRNGFKDSIEFSPDSKANDSSIMVPFKGTKNIFASTVTNTANSEDGNY
jgi:hypothetical protein